MSGSNISPAAISTAVWCGRSNSGIGAAPGLKIRACDIEGEDSAVGLEHIPSGGFNRRLASGGEFQHRDDDRTEVPVLAPSVHRELMIIS
jgi:hypothetical protein